MLVASEREEDDDESTTTLKELLWAKKWKRACSSDDSESLGSLSSSESLNTLCDSSSKDEATRIEDDVGGRGNMSDLDEDEMELTEDDVQFLLDNTGE